MAESQPFKALAKFSQDRETIFFSFWSLSRKEMSKFSPDQIENSERKMSQLTFPFF